MNLAEKTKICTPKNQKPIHPIKLQIKLKYPQIFEDVSKNINHINNTQSDNKSIKPDNKNINAIIAHLYSLIGVIYTDILNLDAKTNICCKQMKLNRIWIYYLKIQIHKLNN